MRKALVVDDSKTIRLILSQTLASLGYDVSSASNGKEAIETMNHDPFITVALVDWNMPVMNGLEFVKAMRADNRFAEVKIVMVTTETEFEQMNAALSAGADDYVMKPFTAEIISERLQALEV